MLSSGGVLAAAAALVLPRRQHQEEAAVMSETANGTVLPTAPVADALMQLKIPIRQAPAGIRTISVATPLVGQARPVQHAGSVDIFLEALEETPPGSVMVIDNGGRQDEACIGDLIALEAKLAGVAAILIWGLHRDEAEIQAMGMPVFSYGTLAVGPTAVRARSEDALTRAQCGDAEVTADDLVVVDADGAVFVPATQWPEVAKLAAEIQATERRQADGMRSGQSLRAQLDFAGYLARRMSEPSYSLREHLRQRGGAIET
jgi:4-hydroxy-4-methyl-2-oxoglutarate aldolase